MTKLNHLAIIMDGNRRWAKAKNLSTREGHLKGYENVKRVGKLCLEKGIKTLTIFAFSTENWNRSKTEVAYLMKLLNKAFNEEIEKFHELGVKINVIASEEKLNKTIKDGIKRIQEKTKNNTKGVLNICFNYGGRLEIVEAVKKIVEENIKPEKITEDTISENIWFKGQPEPDLIVRTSGEQRLSGFLTWTSVYSEFYFPTCHWPDFNEKELDKAINEYERRQRRYGC